jgi:hypothetical protein
MKINMSQQVLEIVGFFLRCSPLLCSFRLALSLGVQVGFFSYYSLASISQLPYGNIGTIPVLCRSACGWAHPINKAGIRSSFP